jgi:hypothetical protein
MKTKLLHWLKPAGVLMLVATLLLSGTANATAAWWQPTALKSWQWQLTWPVDTSKAVQVYDIDYDGSGNGTQAQVTTVVNTLHSQGKQAICYLETGSWESYRPDSNEYNTAWLGATLGGYPSEKYVDLNQLFTSSTGPTGLTLRQILDARFQQCKSEGFNGVETDLDDTYTDTTGFSTITKAVNENFNETLAGDIHNLGLAWFLKNGVNGDSFITDQLAQPASNAPDGTINEQCWQYGECSALKPFVTANKPILNTEYSGQQATVCPKALAFPMATMRKGTSLPAAVTWECW